MELTKAQTILVIVSCLSSLCLVTGTFWWVFWFLKVVLKEEWNKLIILLTPVIREEKGIEEIKQDAILDKINDHSSLSESTVGSFRILDISYIWSKRATQIISGFTVPFWVAYIIYIIPS